MRRPLARDASPCASPVSSHGLDDVPSAPRPAHSREGGAEPRLRVARPDAPACHARLARPRACPPTASRRSPSGPAARRSFPPRDRPCVLWPAWPSNWSASAARRLLRRREEPQLLRNPAIRDRHRARGHRVPGRGLRAGGEAGNRLPSLPGRQGRARPHPPGIGRPGPRAGPAAHCSRRRTAASRPIPPTMVTSSGASSGGPISML